MPRALKANTVFIDHYEGRKIFYARDTRLFFSILDNKEVVSAYKMSEVQAHIRLQAMVKLKKPVEILYIESMGSMHHKAAKITHVDYDDNHVVVKPSRGAAHCRVVPDSDILLNIDKNSSALKMIKTIEGERNDLFRKSDKIQRSLKKFVIRKSMK